VKDHIIKYLRICFKDIYDIEIWDINLETPPKKELGDFAFGCFVIAKELKKSPIDISGELSKYIEEDNSKDPSIDRVSTVGPYLNIFLSAESIADDFLEFTTWNYYENIESSWTVIIDYIWANVWKPLHIGHMCTPSQGQVLINLYKKLWREVIADSHIGDWWIIFWKLLVAYEKYWDDSLLKENAVEHLFDLYVKISSDAENDESFDAKFREYFKLLSQWDAEKKELWAQFTKYSIEAMNILLKRLYVFPDYDIWESFYEWIGLAKMQDYPDLTYPMHEIVEELIEKWVATKNDDKSVGVEFPEDSKLPSCILQKRDGTHGYLASDLACIKYRMQNWNPEKILYFVDVRQQLHFKQAFYIAKAAGWIPGITELSHAHNGFISLKDGAMSTRKWKIIKLDALLDEGQKRALDIIQEKRSDIDVEKWKELAEIISIWAIKYWYLKKSRTSDVIFDWDEFMSFEWNSGPYIQYAYVRAKNIIEKSTNIDEAPLHFSEDIESELATKLMDFPKVIMELDKKYYPHILCQYTYELTKIFSNFYANVEVLTAASSQQKYTRILLLKCFVDILQESFDILWIPLPNEM